MDKSGRDSDGREMVNAPGPKDSGSERPGSEPRGGMGWTKGNPVVPAFDSQVRDLKSTNADHFLIANYKFQITGIKPYTTKPLDVV